MSESMWDGDNSVFSNEQQYIKNEQQSRQIIEALQGRLEHLERINMDLEYRLEDQAKQCIAAERECKETEKQCKNKCNKLEKEIGKWQQENETQIGKSDRLREHLSRTERELYSILQRKHELMRGQGQTQGQVGNKSIRQLGSSSSSFVAPIAQNSWEGGGIGSKGINDLSFEESSNNNSPREARNLQHNRQQEMLITLTEFLGLSG